LHGVITIDETFGGVRSGLIRLQWKGWPSASVLHDDAKPPRQSDHRAKLACSGVETSIWRLVSADTTPESSGHWPVGQRRMSTCPARPYNGRVLFSLERWKNKDFADLQKFRPAVPANSI
jgi:hypothetical protein